MKEEKKWRLSISENNGIIEIVASGEVSAKTANDLENEVFAAVKARNATKLLVDVQNLKGRFGIVDAYYRITRHHNAPLVRTAVVDRDEHEELQRFSEDASYNIGRLRRWFTDIDTARLWLHRPCNQSTA